MTHGKMISYLGTKGFEKIGSMSYQKGKTVIRMDERVLCIQRGHNSRVYPLEILKLGIKDKIFYRDGKLCSYIGI